MSSTRKTGLSRTKFTGLFQGGFLFRFVFSVLVRLLFCDSDSYNSKLARLRLFLGIILKAFAKQDQLLSK